MGQTLKFYSCPAGQIPKLRQAEGLEGLQRRLERNGKLISSLSTRMNLQKLLPAFDELLELSSAKLLGTTLGPLDGRKTTPKAGWMSTDDISDAVEGFDDISSALQLDLEDEDDEDDEDDNSALYELREQLDELADDLDIDLEDLESLVDELQEIFRAVSVQEAELIALGQ